MTKTLKIFVAILFILFIACAIVFLIFQKRYHKMANIIRSEYAAVSNVNLKKIPDGVYNGKFGEFLVSVDLDVEVKNHRIEKITVKKQDCGRGYEALDTIERIIKAQSPKVDAVSGATGSSMVIMIAVNRALTNQK